MATRRELLKLGAVGAFGLAGMKGGDDDVAPLTAPPTASLLAPPNFPIPFAGVFRRPPELMPFESGFDDGDPARPYARYALTQKLGQAQFVPGLSTTVDHVIMVNGVPWPTMKVKPRIYRFRILVASITRSYQHQLREHGEDHALRGRR